MLRHFLFRLALLIAFCGNVYAAIESYDFQNEEQRERYQQLSEELRCPKCQNQNLADSDSQIAADLRKELHQQLLDGKSDEAIVDFMRDRYGDFVLYKPRMQRNTVLLWWGPIGLVLIVAILLWRSRRSVVDITEPVVTSSSSSLQNKNLSAARWINFFSLVVLLLVAAGSLAIYRHLGSLQAIEMTELGRVVFARQLPPEQLVQQQEVLLKELDDWLQSHPDDERFLYMRARLLSEAGIWDRAAADYQNLISQFPDQDNMLAEYAQVLFLKNNRSMTPDVLAFLKQTLQINPHNVTALGLLGMAAFEQQDYRGAVDFWQRLLRVIPPGTPQSETIAEGVARAREMGGIENEPAVVADIRLSVKVDIAAQAQAKPDEAVFVLLRAVNGPRMPLAAVKTTVAALAQPIVLDTATSPMRGQLDLAAIETFEVVARLSRSGQPIPAAGDWEGVGQPFTRSSIPATLSLSVEKAISP
ncbi:MAG TPA: cytochrome c-type biogenesis protein CcmH [Pseudomonadales bacterium]|nr:cytochrome c-type biogenesis protein CcmH [Pseudomonadales bacterium]